MSWQSYLTSHFQLILWTEGTKHYSQASHLVRPYQSFRLYGNTRIGHLWNNHRTFTKRVNFLWFLNLLFFILLCFLFSNFYFYYSCINFIIIILLSLFLSSSLSLLLLCYNTLFSLQTTLSAPSHPLFPPSSPPLPVLPPPVTILTPPSYTLTTNWLAYWTTCTQH
jgi:hypothetical protein